MGDGRASVGGTFAGSAAGLPLSLWAVAGDPLALWAAAGLPLASWRPLRSPCSTFFMSPQVTGRAAISGSSCSAFVGPDFGAPGANGAMRSLLRLDFAGLSGLEFAGLDVLDFAGLSVAEGLGAAFVLPSLLRSDFAVFDVAEGADDDFSLWGSLRGSRNPTS